MASKKEVEVELEEIATVVEEKKAEDEEKQEKKEENVDEGNVYSVLNNPSEHVYGVPSTSSYTVNPDKSDIDRKVRLYRIVSLVLFVICILLLIVALVLFMKLTGTQPCHVTQKTPEQECSLKKCSELHQQSFGETPEQHCTNCGKGWLRFENACYFLSQNRFSWQQSRQECQRRGGDLAVITNERVQMFLSKNGKLDYWIGLSHHGTNEWTWVNNTVLTVRYWEAESSGADCAILASGQPPERSWRPSNCRLYLQYICQKK